MTQNQVDKRNNVFPVLYIVAIVVTTVFSIIGIRLIEILGMSYNEMLTAEENHNIFSKAVFFYFFYGVIMLVPSYFLLKHEKLKWCVVFILAGAVLMLIEQNNMNDQMFESVDMAIQADLSLEEDVTAGERFIVSVVAILFQLLAKIPSIVTINSAIVLSAAILWANDVKVFTVLTIVSTVIVAFLGVVSWPVILFMGLAIRKDFDILLFERAQSKKK